MNILKNFITAILFFSCSFVSSAYEYCEINYTVGQPMTDMEIRYVARIWWDTHSNDYLIEYRNANDSTISFVANIGDTDYYRFDGRKLSEYHRANDSIPFIGTNPVTKSGIIYPFIPSVVMQEINNLCADTQNKVSENNSGVKYITQYIAGHEARDIKYTASSDNLPLLYDALNNPGQMGEQSLTVTYTYPENVSIPMLSESMLIERYPEQFASLRSNNFSVTQLTGKPLPTISAISVNGEQYEITDKKSQNRIIVFIESGAGLNEYTISQIRQGVDQCAFPSQLIWIYSGRNLDAIYEEIGRAADDEILLLGGKRAATKLGITGYPTILFVNKKGIVSNISIGTNNDLKSIVIQYIEQMNKNNKE